MADLLKDIAIVGGGLTGPTLALNLKKQGISCTIYELHSKDYMIGGPIVLASNALRVLDRVGIYSTLQKNCFNYEYLKLVNNSGKVLGSVSSGNVALFQYPTIRALRPDIRAELLKECEAAGIKIVYGKGLTEVVEDENGAKLRFNDETEEAASLVIGADGPNSIVRKNIAPAAEPAYSGHYLVYGKMPRSVFNKLNEGKQTVAEPALIFGREGSFCTIPLGHDAEIVGFFGSFALADRSQDEWYALKKDKEAQRALLIKQYCQGNWDKDVEILCRETKAEDLFSWPTVLTPELDTWFSPSGRIILAGDSAHAMPPAAAQGAAMSFEDAETLAYMLGRYKARSTDVASKTPLLTEFLKKWQDHRKARVRQVIAFTNMVAKLRTPSNWALLQYIKEWFISILMKVKGQEGYRWLYGYDANSEEVKKSLE